MININENKCVGCLKCIQHCPAGIIDVKNNKAFVTNHEQCLLCGHCQAVCSSSAITISNLELFDEEVKLNGIDYNELKNLIKSNRSIRRFKDNLVEDSLIMDILQTLEFTGSAKNEQPVKWILVSGYDKVSEISDIAIDHLKDNNLLPGLIQFIENVRNPITVDAPHLLIAYAETNSIKPYDDCMIKMSLATLLMSTKGIGSCYLGYLADFSNNFPDLKKHLGISETQTVYSVIGFGYSNENYTKIPSRKKPTINKL